MAAFDALLAEILSWLLACAICIGFVYYLIFGIPKSLTSTTSSQKRNHFNDISQEFYSTSSSDLHRQQQRLMTGQQTISKHQRHPNSTRNRIDHFMVDDDDGQTIMKVDYKNNGHIHSSSSSWRSARWAYSSNSCIVPYHTRLVLIKCNQSS